MQIFTMGKERAARALAGRTVTVEAALVERRDLLPVFSFSANLEAVWSSDISAKADGRIDLKLLVEEGRQSDGRHGACPTRYE